MESTSQKNNPVWLGIKLFFVDVGISVAVVAIAGVIFGAARVGEEVIIYLGIVIGLVVSMYAAFLLYKRYSQETVALVALVITGFIFSAMGFPELVKTMPSTQALLLTLATVVAFGVGWYLAKQTGLKIFLFGNKWVTAFFIIGIIVSFFIILQFVSFIAV